MEAARGVRMRLSFGDCAARASLYCPVLTSLGLTTGLAAGLAAGWAADRAAGCERGASLDALSWCWPLRTRAGWVRAGLVSGVVLTLSLLLLAEERRLRLLLLLLLRLMLGGVAAVTDVRDLPTSLLRPRRVSLGWLRAVPAAGWPPAGAAQLGCWA